jgi:CheY-like chemotaxis protein
MSGMQVLVVEDEPLIAMSMQMLVEDCGWSVLGPFDDIDTVLKAINAGARVDCALLDCNLKGKVAWPVAEALERMGVPFAFTSGQGARDIDARFASRPIFTKPVDEELVKRFLQGVARP